ncbi:hypothetical protein, partial [Nonomuraea sp. NPDC049784]|uniref:hypothetical protein n=1 Tax=Nonomuraea sp. NPDC049784 TaxID=3154361 RepID=UPI0033EA1716
LTASEIEAARRTGVDLEALAYALGAGASLGQALSMHAAGVDLWEYGSCLSDGLTHHEVRCAHGAGINVRLYRRARRAGISDDHIYAAHRAGIDVFVYHAARQTGASDRRVRAAQRAGINLREYVLARWAGATDQQVRAAHRVGRDFSLTGSGQQVTDRAETLQALLILDGWLSRHMRPPADSFSRQQSLDFTSPASHRQDLEEEPHEALGIRVPVRG